MCTCWKKGKGTEGRRAATPHLLRWAKAQPMAWGAEQSVSEHGEWTAIPVKNTLAFLAKQKAGLRAARPSWVMAISSLQTKSMSAVNRVICYSERFKMIQPSRTGSGQVVFVPCLCQLCRVFETQGRLLTSFACCSAGSILLRRCLGSHFWSPARPAGDSWIVESTDSTSWKITLKTSKCFSLKLRGLGRSLVDHLEPKWEDGPPKDIQGLKDSTLG